MREPESKVGDVRTKLSSWEILLSIGLELQLCSEILFNECDALEPDTALRQSSILFKLSTVLGAVLTQHEPRLKVLVVNLPDGMSAITVMNPFFDHSTKDPSVSTDGSLRDGGDDSPF